MNENKVNLIAKKIIGYKREKDTEIDLYIKFCIEGRKNKKHVLIISIHEDIYL